MHTVVLVGARHRGWKRSVDNMAIIKGVLEERRKQLGEHAHELNVASMSCDAGFGKDLRVYCEEEGVKFCEFVVYFNGPRDRAEYNRAYRARHAALVDIGDEFFIAVLNSRKSTVEDLVERVRDSGKTYVLYDDTNNIIEYRDALREAESSKADEQQA